MSGPEQPLLASLASAASVVVPHDQPSPIQGNAPLRAGEPWPAEAPRFWQADYADDQQDDSRNWWKLALSCRLLLGSPAERVDADAKAIGLLRDERDRYGFMSSECGSRVYGTMHLLFALACLRAGSPELRQLAKEWLQLLFFWLRRLPMFGFRSCEPGREQRNVTDDLRDWLLGRGPFPDWPGFEPPSGLILKQFRPELTAASLWPEANPRWKTMRPVCFVVGERRTVGWIGGTSADGANDNTPTIPGVAEDRDARGAVLAQEWAPHPPYERIREQSDGAVAVLAPDEESVTCGLRGLRKGDGSQVYPEVALAFPPRPRYRVQLGDGTLGVQDISPAAPQQKAPPPQTVPGRPAPAPPPAQPAGKKKSGGLPVPLIVGAVVGAVALVIALGHC